MLPLLEERNLFRMGGPDGEETEAEGGSIYAIVRV